MKGRSVKTDAWFIKVRGSYLPHTWQGWLSYVPYIAFLIASYVIVMDQSATMARGLIGVVPYWVSAAVVMQWFASRHS